MSRSSRRRRHRVKSWSRSLSSRTDVRRPSLFDSYRLRSRPAYEDFPSVRRNIPQMRNRYVTSVYPTSFRSPFMRAVQSPKFKGVTRQIEKLSVCGERSERRRMIFATNSAGGGNRPPVWTKKSYRSCK